MIVLRVVKQRLVNEKGEPLKIRPEIAAGEKMILRFEFDCAPDPAALYRLTGNNVPNSADDLMLYSDTFTVDGNAVSFRCDARTAGFLKKAQFGRQPLLLELTGRGEKSERVLLRDFIFSVPRQDLGGVRPSEIERYYERAEIDRKLAGKAEAKHRHAAADIDGLADLPDNRQQPASLITELKTNTPEWGAVNRLDPLFPQLRIAERAWRIAELRLVLVSSDPAVSGNIMLVPAVNGVERATVAAPVGPEPAEFSIPLDVPDGQVSLRRDYEAPEDTLRGSSAPVTAYVLRVEWRR